ncbi:phage head closure protein [Desulfosporosinus sp. SB140]|uniref:phage head closure protein n=1 Tax=Desulfosporosinus paludis TaxID=3115649 RepID=UPI00388DC05C
MKSVKFNKKIDIQNYARVENEVGEEMKQWQSFAKVWAHFLKSYIKIDEPLKAEKNVENIYCEIVIRYREDIDTAMRVVYQEKSYSIDHVVNDKEQNIETHLFCTLIEEGVYNE